MCVAFFKPFCPNCYFLPISPVTVVPGVNGAICKAVLNNMPVLLKLLYFIYTSNCCVLPVLLWSAIWLLIKLIKDPFSSVSSASLLSFTLASSASLPSWRARVSWTSPRSPRPCVPDREQSSIRSNTDWALFIIVDTWDGFSLMSSHPSLIYSPVREFRKQNVG